MGLLSRLFDNFRDIHGLLKTGDTFFLASEMGNLS